MHACMLASIEFVMIKYVKTCNFCLSLATFESGSLCYQSFPRTVLR
jgi:hypothetical protein